MDDTCAPETPASPCRRPAPISQGVFLSPGAAPLEDPSDNPGDSSEEDSSGDD